MLLVCGYVVSGLARRKDTAFVATTRTTCSPSGDSSGLSIHPFIHMHTSIQLSIHWTMYSLFIYPSLYSFMHSLKGQLVLMSCFASSLSHPHVISNHKILCFCLTSSGKCNRCGGSLPALGCWWNLCWRGSYSRRYVMHLISRDDFLYIMLAIDWFIVIDSLWLIHH